jgi:hypothetical protein
MALQVEEDNVRAILLNISLRIRPCFEKPKVLYFTRSVIYGSAPSSLLSSFRFRDRHSNIERSRILRILSLHSALYPMCFDKPKWGFLSSFDCCNLCSIAFAFAHALIVQFDHIVIIADRYSYITNFQPQVRAAAIRLFGNLSRFGDGPSREPFSEQVGVFTIIG